MADPIVIRPGGFITAEPRHEIGLRGASPFLTSISTIEGFQNLISYYGKFAYPLMNSTGDVAGSNVTNYLGNDISGTQDRVDMALQPMLATIVPAGGGGIGGNYLESTASFPLRKSR